MDLLDVLRGTLNAGGLIPEERRNPGRPHAGGQRNIRPHRDHHEPRHAGAIERRQDYDVVTAGPRFESGPPFDFSGSSSESEYSPRRRHHRHDDYLRDHEPFPEEIEHSPRRGHHRHADFLRDDELFPEIEDVPRGRHRPNVEAILLPVQSATLPEDEQTCSICMNKYDTPSTATRTEPSETEPAVRLICNHVIGKNCIQHWLDDGNTVCPLCRTDVYTGAAPPET